MPSSTSSPVSESLSWDKFSSWSKRASGVGSDRTVEDADGRKLSSLTDVPNADALWGDQARGWLNPGGEWTGLVNGAKPNPGGGMTGAGPGGGGNTLGNWSQWRRFLESLRSRHTQFNSFLGSK